MKITKVTCFPVTLATSKAKANGTVTVEGAIDLKYVLMQGPKDLFVSWAGGRAYTKKDGTKGWDSPIYITDEATSKSINEQIISKFKSVSGAKASQASSPTIEEDLDQMPF
jgi:hypothetical protein